MKRMTPYKSPDLLNGFFYEDQKQSYTIVSRDGKDYIINTADPNPNTAVMVLPSPAPLVPLTKEADNAG